MDREMEVLHLNKADARIADAERHITAQKLLVERLRMSEQDIREAEHILDTMETLLAACYEHRRQIVEMIERIDAGLA